MAGSEAPALRKPPGTATPHPPTATAPVVDSTRIWLVPSNRRRSARGRHRMSLVALPGSVQVLVEGVENGLEYRHSLFEVAEGHGVGCAVRFWNV